MVHRFSYQTGTTDCRTDIGPSLDPPRPGTGVTAGRVRATIDTLSYLSNSGIVCRIVPICDGLV